MPNVAFFGLNKFIETSIKVRILQRFGLERSMNTKRKVNIVPKRISLALRRLRKSRISVGSPPCSGALGSTRRSIGNWWLDCFYMTSPQTSRETSPHQRLPELDSRNGVDETSKSMPERETTVQREPLPSKTELLWKTNRNCR